MNPLRNTPTLGRVGSDCLSESNVESSDDASGVRIKFDSKALMMVIPKSGTKLFLKRINGWQEIVKNLILYVEEILSIERKRYGDIVKTGREYLGTVSSHYESAGGLRDESFSAFEMHQVLLKCMQDSSMQLKLNLETSIASVTQDVIGGLKTILQEIRKKSQESEKEWTELDKELNQDRQDYRKYKNNLRMALDDYKYITEPANLEKPSKINPKHNNIDPYVASITLIRHICKCLEKRERYSNLILEQQASFFAYEVGIVLKPLYACMSAFFQWKITCSSLAADTYTQLLGKIKNPDYEKSLDVFVSHNKDYLSQKDIKSKSDIINAASAMVPDFRSCVVYSNIMSRRSQQLFSTKPSLKEHMGIVTSYGFLHLFDSTANPSNLFHCLTIPEVSIYLPNCTVETKKSSEGDSEIVLTEKKVGLFVREQKYKIMGDSPANTAKIFEVINFLYKYTNPESAPQFHMEPKAIEETSSKPRRSTSSTAAKKTIDITDDTNMMNLDSTQDGSTDDKTPDFSPHVPKATQGISHTCSLNVDSENNSPRLKPQAPEMEIYTGGAGIIPEGPYNTITGEVSDQGGEDPAEKANNPTYDYDETMPQNPWSNDTASDHFP